MRLRALCVLLCLAGAAEQRTPAPAGGAGGSIRRGGQLVVAERSAPRTFNPVVATDTPSKTILERINADLIHINRRTLAHRAGARGVVDVVEGRPPVHDQAEPRPQVLGRARR